MIKSFVTGLLILLGLALTETAILSNITFLPAIPDLLMIAALYFSIINGKSYGVVLGFFSGLFLDYLSGCPFGFNCLLRTLIGYFGGFLFETINYKGIFMPMLLGLCVSLAKVIFTWLISLFYPNFVINYSIFSSTFLVELVLNIILTPVFFKLFSCFNKSLALRAGDLN